jgi:hypothetical protein
LQHNSILPSSFFKEEEEEEKKLSSFFCEHFLEIMALFKKLENFSHIGIKKRYSVDSRIRKKNANPLIKKKEKFQLNGKINK